jgi:2-C-methyl-D-erythritol 4-phosphate cytidylyltransferase
MMVAAVVTAAGSGTRMGSATPKQFLSIDGMPLLAHTLRALCRSSLVGAVVTVVPAPFVESTAAMIAADPALGRCLPPVPGGRRRQDSVRAGFDALPRCELVLIHDGARPLVSPAVIAATIGAARRHGAAIAAVPSADTVKTSEDGILVSSTLDRRRIWLVQTPQVFRWDLLRGVYDTLPSSDVTDEAMLMEAAGHAVAIAPGDPMNIKVTTPADMRLAAFILGDTQREAVDG